MTAEDATPETAGLDPRVERCRRVLDVLNEVGMNLARGLDPQHGTFAVPDPVLAFCRLSRALRLNMLIELRLEAVASGLPELAAVEAAAAEEVDAPDAAEAPEPAERGERNDRPERPDREAPDEVLRWARRPLSELVGAACRDLDVAPDLAREAEAAFAALAANDGSAPAGEEPASFSASEPEPAAGCRPAPRKRRDAALGP